MTANNDDSSNVTQLRTGGTRSPDSVGPVDDQPADRQTPPPEQNECGQVFAFPGGFENRKLESIARRLCEHMNLNYNLCCQLEHIADNLPDNVDRQECLYVARSVVPMVKLAHDFEENVLFPILRERCSNSVEIDKTLDRLQGEHWEDESYAAEIHHGLISFASGLSEISVDSLGYMLRGFFEGMRRHLAFEREHVLPLLRSLDAPA